MRIDSVNRRIGGGCRCRSAGNSCHNCHCILQKKEVIEYIPYGRNGILPYLVLGKTASDIFEHVMKIWRAHFIQI